MLAKLDIHIRIVQQSATHLLFYWKDFLPLKKKSKKRFERCGFCWDGRGRLETLKLAPFIHFLLLFFFSTFLSFLSSVRTSLCVSVFFPQIFFFFFSFFPRLISFPISKPFDFLPLPVGGTQLCTGLHTVLTVPFLCPFHYFSFGDKAASLRGIVSPSP